MTLWELIDHGDAMPDPLPNDVEESASTDAGTTGDSTDTPPEAGASRHSDGEGQTDIPHHLFSTAEDLFAPTDWGDVLRFTNFRHDQIRLTTDQEGRRRLLLHNPSTGMWRMQEDPDFQPLFDVLLSEANDAALAIVEDDPTIGNRVKGRLRRHIESSSGSSVSKALRRSHRLADDPCVPIDRVASSYLNPVDRHPVILCQRDPVRLNDGTSADPSELNRLFLLDMTPAPTTFVRDAIGSEAPGAVMMQRFLRCLGNGDDTLVCRRLGWQLCGHHQAIDVIAGDCDALALLGRALRDTLGPSGARILSMGRGTVTARRIADSMEQARLSLWMGADTVRTLPIWELHSLTSDLDTRRQGNLTLLVADWPSDWDTLDHRMVAKCGWAWRVEAASPVQGIDADLLLNPDGREYLLAKLVEGAIDGHGQFQATKGETGVGDPVQVAADDFTRACAEELRLAGAAPEHRTLYRALQFTDDDTHVMTLSDVDEAITDIGEEPIPHHVVGKMIRRMWPQVQSSRGRIDGAQTRVIRGITARSHQ